jgi:long-chain acyl-CoA synthetase
MSDRTILDLYRHELEEPREDHYVHYFEGGQRSAGTLDFFRRTAALADALEGLGVGLGDRVMILCDTRPEWHMIDIAVLSLRAVNAPIYSTLTPQQVAYQVRDSGAVVAVADNAEQMAKFLEVRATCPNLRQLVQVEGPRSEGVIALDELMGTVLEGAEERFWERAGRVKEENIVNNVYEARERFEFEKGDYGIEYLPLCHMIERIVGYILMSYGAPRAYCSVFQIAELIKVIQPTVLVSVPRVLEKVHAAVMAKANAASPVRRALFHWAIAVGWEVARRRLAGQPIGSGLGLKHRVADRLVLAKVREALGGRMKGSLEVWGLTETSPIITLNGYLPEDMRVGSVGRPLPSYEMRVAEDGELLAKGPSVFKGYWNKPERTAEVFDDDGFFHTGDIGSIDDDGFIFITDRKKDLIVTAGGKNIAPQPVESELKQSPFIENAVLIGDGRPFVVALLAPNPEVVAAWADEHGADVGDLGSVLGIAELAREFAQAIEGVNSELARFEQIKEYRVLPEPLTVEGGALTPTLKVKRRVVAEEYSELIEEMYAS